MVKNPTKTSTAATAAVPAATTENGDSQLLCAAQAGDLDMIRARIKAGSDVNLRSPADASFYPSLSGGSTSFDISPLAAAAEYGQADAVRLLLEYGAVVDMGSTDGVSPLYAASAKGHLEAVRLLLSGGANVEAGRPKECFTPLYIACAKGKTAVVEALLDAGADTEASTDKHDTPLIISASNGHHHCVRKLLTAGADPAATKPWARSCPCARCGAKAQTMGGEGALYYACSQGRLEAARLLIQAGAPCTDACADGTTVLMAAAADGHSEIIEEILKHDVNVNKARDNGDTALALAAHNGHTRAIELLIQAGADVSISVGENEEVPLFIAAKMGRVAATVTLLEHGAEHSAANCFGTTPLYIAAHKGHAEVVETLIEAGADVDAARHPKWGGDTPLIIATYSRQPPVVKMLVEAGANVNQRNTGGSTALSYAVDLGTSDQLRYLLAGGADVEAYDSTQKTPLLEAARFLSIATTEEQKKDAQDVLDALVEAGADLSRSIAIARKQKKKQAVQKVLLLLKMKQRRDQKMKKDAKSSSVLNGELTGNALADAEAKAEQAMLELLEGEESKPISKSKKKKKKKAARKKKQAEREAAAKQAQNAKKSKDEAKVKSNSNSKGTSTNDVTKSTSMRKEDSKSLQPAVSENITTSAKDKLKSQVKESKAKTVKPTSSNNDSNQNDVTEPKILDAAAASSIAAIAAYSCLKTAQRAALRAEKATKKAIATREEENIRAKAAGAAYAAKSAAKSAHRARDLANGAVQSARHHRQRQEMEQQKQMEQQQQQQHLMRQQQEQMQQRQFQQRQYQQMQYQQQPSLPSHQNFHSQHQPMPMQGQRHLFKPQTAAGVSSSSAMHNRTNNAGGSDRAWSNGMQHQGTSIARPASSNSNSDLIWMKTEQRQQQGFAQPSSTRSSSTASRGAGGWGNASSANGYLVSGLSGSTPTRLSPSLQTTGPPGFDMNIFNGALQLPSSTQDAVQGRQLRLNSSSVETEHRQVPPQQGAECYIFFCNSPHVVHECVNRRIFGDSAHAWNSGSMQTIVPSTQLFLFDFSSYRFYGAFRASEAPALNIDPLAFTVQPDGSRLASTPLPSQIRIMDSSTCPPTLGVAGTSIQKMPMWLKGSGVYTKQQVASLLSGNQSSNAAGRSPTPAGLQAPLEPTFAGLSLGGGGSTTSAFGGAFSTGGGLGSAMGMGGISTNNARTPFSSNFGSVGSNLGFSASAGGALGIGRSHKSGRRTTSRLACFANLEPESGSESQSANASPVQSLLSPGILQAPSSGNFSKQNKNNNNSTIASGPRPIVDLM
eukprot:g1254.t1